MDALHLTPLWSVDHLPLKGGDQATGMVSVIAIGSSNVQHACKPISPLEGEMPGRAEGGRRAPVSPKKCIP